MLLETAPKEFLQTAQMFGPAQGSILESLEDPHWFSLELQRAKYAINIKAIDLLVNMRGNGGKNATLGPTYVFWIRPLSNQPVPRVEFEIYVPTPYLSIIVMARLITLVEAERLHLLKNLGSRGVSPARDAAASIFEAAVHAHLASGNSLTVSWYTLLGAQRFPHRSNNQPHGQANLLCIPESDPAPVLYHDIDLIIYHCETHLDCHIDEVPSSYWRPMSPDFPTIDSVLFTKGVVYLIQAAVSRPHESIFGGATKRNWW